MRSYGVRLWVIGQDIEQFQKAYPASWGGFLGNAEAVQFLGITHEQTVEMLVKMLGQHFVRPLLDADQVRRLLGKEWGTQIVWRGSKRPMLLRTAPYFDYLPYWYYEPDRRFREPFLRRLWRALG